jgi:phycoerythrin-associated linker protein
MITPAFLPAAPCGGGLSASASALLCGGARLVVVPACAADAHVAATGTRRPVATPATTRTSMVTSGDSGITLQSLKYAPNSTGSTSVADKEVMCIQIYKQVFGNAYVMESERGELYPAESMYRAGRLSVKEFVRKIALSATYRRRFFEACGPYRAVELNFKHLLGRGPNSKEEVAEHIQRTIHQGYEADINSFLDSPEYDSSFGDFGLPGMLFKGTYPSLSEFTSMCSMYSAHGTSDKSLVRRAKAIGTDNPNHILSLDGAGTPSKLVSLASSAGFPTSIVRIKNALPSRPDLDFGVDTTSRLSSSFLNKHAAPRRRVTITDGNYMYLTAAEADEFERGSIADMREESLVKAEMRAATAEIARLQARLKTLSSAL